MSGVVSPLPAWCSREVVAFHGQGDSHLKSGDDYDGLHLSSVFVMEPGRAVKSRALAMIPSTYRDHDARCHARQREVGSFVSLCVDVDKGDHAQDRVKGTVDTIAVNSASLIYSSAHSRPCSRRWRVLLPLRNPLSFDDWHDAQCGLFALFERDGIAVDHALARSGQPVYLPNVPDVHAKSGEALRGADGAPLYYARSTTGCRAEGIDPGTGALADAVAAIRRQRAADERERERIRAVAEQRRANRPRSEGGAIIAEFNGGNDLVTLLQAYGYELSPRHAEDWRSPHQSSDSYATRVIGDKWVSLSASDAAARLGDQFKSGCYGDAYDLFAHFEHGGDHRSAFRQLYSERRAEMAYQKFGRPVPLGEAC